VKLEINMAILTRASDPMIGWSKPSVIDIKYVDAPVLSGNAQLQIFRAQGLLLFWMQSECSELSGLSVSGQAKSGQLEVPTAEVVRAR
jgi:hypothetical protein